jgi:Stealth protein CR2, conserved region 2/Stealth protein CR3, conserved region 3/Stealth protein CR4, conserved region 4/Stealth protein CR1, conserved region 1
MPKKTPRPALSLVPSGLAARTDIVDRAGRLTLVNETRTPHEAMVQDLLFVRRVLDAAGVRALLIRHDDARPTLAIERDDYPAAEAALVAASASEPFYADTLRPKDLSRKGEPLLVAGGRLSASASPRVLRLYRPRAAPGGSLAYGAAFAVQLEVWRRAGEEMHVPVENAVTRRRLPLAEYVETRVERYGHTWPTLENMFDQLASDVDFEVDIIFSWVDGSDIAFQRARAQRMESYVVGEGDDAEARYRQVDELRYALRSVYLYAPWIRNIYIATDSPAPSWLAEHPRVRIVRSEEFFADTSVLPTHNSQAVESQLHRIPGLSEYYLYSNDDMFFGRPVGPEMFFSPGGLTKFIEATTRIGLGENDAFRSGFENAARVNRRLLRERFGRVTTRHLEHTAAPFKKSVVQELEQTFPEEFARTAASRFRSATDISVTNSLYHYFALFTGRAVQKVGAKVLYVDTTTRKGLALLDRLLRKRSFDFFCLNDGSFPEVGAEERAQAMRAFLEQYYAIPAPWEAAVTAVGEEPAELTAS